MQSDWPDGLNEDDVRLTAYFLWEQEGRPDTNPDDYWERALAIHRRAHANGLELEAGLASQGEGRDEANSGDQRS
jgi:hypothetical protein